MLRLLLFLTLAALLPADDGADDGRRGNTLYASEAYEAAAAAYRAGLEPYADAAAVPDAVHSGLLNNLGAALYRTEDFEGAQQAFASAFRLAPTATEATRAAYNAGNAAFQQQDLDAALALYREALLADPDNRDAKVNYEFVKRMQEQQQEQEQQQDGEGEQDNQEQQDGDGQQEQQQDGQQEQQDGEQEGDQDGDGQPDDEQESDQEQQGQAGDQGQQQQEQSAQPEPDPNQLSQQEAERILQALQNEETDLLREAMKVKARPRRVEKDW